MSGPNIAGSSFDNVAIALRSGLLTTDRAFDRLLSPDVRAASNQHWTPLDAAVRASQWLDDVGAETVVDIGSGAGKFCVVAALAGRCRFVGIEQRAHLVREARVLARRFSIDDRVSFAQSTFGSSTTTPIADAYYLYNPFGENVLSPFDRLDEAVELSAARYERDVAAVVRLLNDARTGTHVLTYNGFGGHIPRSYREVRVDRELPSVLRLWTKT
jgi:predicted RNA methylase